MDTLTRQRVCVICSAELTGKQLNACSSVCANKVYAIRRRESGKLKKANMSPKKAQALQEKKNEWKRQNPDRVRAGRNPYRGGKLWIRADIRFAIYERDNWTCQLCHMPVPKEQQYDRNTWQPLWPNLDHIVPQSLSDNPNHDPSNLRLAHAVCNTARNANTNWEPSQDFIAGIEIQLREFSNEIYTRLGQRNQ